MISKITVAIVEDDRELLDILSKIISMQPDMELAAGFDNGLDFLENFAELKCDVVIMDNLSSHKRTRTRELIESAEATVDYLPPYSPDLNPIEMIFSKVKQLLRSLACRTRDQLWSSMQSVLDRVTGSDARNCFEHCGYTLQAE